MQDKRVIALIAGLLALVIGILWFLSVNPPTNSDGIISVKSESITEPPSKVEVITLKDVTGAQAPDQVRIRRGEGVTWKNTADKALIVTSPDGYFSSGLIPQGEEYTFQFLQTGTFTVTAGEKTQTVFVAEATNAKN